MEEAERNVDQLSGICTDCSNTDFNFDTVKECCASTAVSSWSIFNRGYRMCPWIICSSIPVLFQDRTISVFTWNSKEYGKESNKKIRGCMHVSGSYLFNWRL